MLPFSFPSIAMPVCWLCCWRLFGSFVGHFGLRKNVKEHEKHEHNQTMYIKRWCLCNEWGKKRGLFWWFVEKKQRKGIIWVLSHPNHHCFFLEKKRFVPRLKGNGQFLHDKKVGIDKTPMYSIAGTCNRSPWCFDVLVGEEQCNFLRVVLTRRNKEFSSKMCQDVNGYPGKLTCPPKKITIPKKKCPLPGIDFQGRYVCLQGNTPEGSRYVRLHPGFPLSFQSYDLAKIQGGEVWIVSGL